MPNHFPLVAALARESSGLSADWRIVQNMPPSAHRETDPQPVRSLEFHRVCDTYWHTADSWHEETGRNIPAKVAAWALEHQTRTPDPVRHRSGPWTARRCSPTCNGWAVISGAVQRCDACDRWRSDAGACDHVERAHNALTRAARLALADLQDITLAEGGDPSPAMIALRAALKLATGEA